MLKAFSYSFQWEVLAAQTCPALCNPMDCSPPHIWEYDPYSQLPANMKSRDKQEPGQTSRESSPK